MAILGGTARVNYRREVARLGKSHGRSEKRNVRTIRQARKLDAEI